MILHKDGGHGVTELSLKFWHDNKDKLGVITGATVVKDGFDDDAEYSMIIYGNEGNIYLSGCNCGYGGTGPNGTAKILEEIGVPTEVARKAMYHTKISLFIKAECIILDGVGYKI